MGILSTSTGNLVVRYTRLLFGRVCVFGAALTPLFAQDDGVAQAHVEGQADFVALDAYEVTGTRPQTVDTSTLKLPVAVKDVPRSVSVVDASRIREQDFQSAADLLFWVPGLNSNGDSYHFYARGYRMLPGDWKVDGFTGRVIGGSYAPNLFGVENVTVLKGPAGLLYGATNSPGGQINFVTKKPQVQSAASVEMRVRTFAGGEASLGERVGYELETDFTGPLTRDARLRYRFLSSHERAITPALADENQFYRLNVAYQLDADGRFEVTPVVEWSRESRPQRSATISPSSSRLTNDGRIDAVIEDASPRDVALSAGGRVDENFTGGADLTARFTSAWHASASIRLHERQYENDAYTVNTATLAQRDPADVRSWVVSRRHTRTDNRYKTASIDLNSSYELQVGSRVRSLWQVGVNARRSDTRTSSSGNGANQSPINIYTGVAETALVANAPALGAANDSRSTVWNAYLQTQTELFERWVLTLGAGHAEDRTSGRATANGGVTPNGGLVFRVSDKVSAYASYSTSFALADATREDEAGRANSFAPTEGENFELGVKAAFWRDVIAASFSVFDMALNGVLVQSAEDELNPNGNRFYRQLDNGRASRGAEVEFTLAPLPAWETTVTYAYLDAYNRNDDGSRGAPAELTPRHAASVYSRYAFFDGPLAGWSVRLGLIWQDERWGAAPTTTAPDPLRLDAFHRIDAGVSYAWRQWRLAVNVENLTNEFYYVAGSTGLNLNPVNPRAVALRVGRRW